MANDAPTPGDLPQAFLQCWGVGGRHPAGKQNRSFRPRKVLFRFQQTPFEADRAFNSRQRARKLGGERVELWSTRPSEDKALVPLADLSPRDLLWGRPKPGMPDRADGYWLVHGHTVVRAPQLAGRRVNVDTGAFDSNLLTAAVIAPGAPIRFLGTL